LLNLVYTGKRNFVILVTSIDSVDSRSVSKHHTFPAFLVPLNGVLVGTDTSLIFFFRLMEES